MVGLDHETLARIAGAANTGDTLRPLDAAYLAIEDGGTPMHLTGLVSFTTPDPVRPTRVAGLLTQRAARIPRFARRLRPGRDGWVEDPNYDPDWHVRVHRLAAADAAELDAFLSRVTSTPLDPQRPLWQAHVITDPGGRGLAVLFKLHHVLVSDGLDGLRLLLLLSDSATSHGPESHHGDEESAGIVAADRTEPVGVLALPIRLFGRSRDTLAGLPAVAARMWQVTRVASDVAGGTRWLPSARVFPAGSGNTRRCAMVTLSLDGIKRIRGYFANDVLLAVLTGAFRRWLSARGIQLDNEAVLRAFIPVSLRNGLAPLAGHSPLSGCLCDLPVGLAEPEGQLRAIRVAMDANRKAEHHRGAGAIPLLADMVPASVHRVVTPLLSKGASLLFDTVVSSVQAPSVSLSLAGAEATGWHVFGPVAPGQALTTVLITYRDQVHVGLNADERAMPDLDSLAAAIPDALRALCEDVDTGAVVSPLRGVSDG